MRSLVTGAAGFVGQWLARALLNRGEELYGLTLEGAPGPGILDRRELSAVRWMMGDIRDSAAVQHALADSRADAVYHLAGMTFVPDATADPVSAYEVNTLGVVRLLEAVTRLRRSSEVRVLIVGSAEQYGPHSETEQPLRETAELRPITVYAATKTAQEMIALQQQRSTGVHVVATRSFNHSGPGQASQFLLPALVRRALAASHGSPFTVGNTTPVRDFLHVTDVVAAYIALIAGGESGEVYNVSSARGWSVGELVELVLRVANLDTQPTRDESLARSVDVQWLVGDNTKLRQQTGWHPTRTVEDIIRELWSQASASMIS